MDAKSKTELKEILLKIKEQKINEIKQNNEDLRSTDSFQNDAQDSADTATNIYDKELHSELTEKNKQLLTSVEEAIKKINDGKYGTCESCEKDISLERLKAMPFSKMCIKCQSVAEKK